MQSLKVKGRIRIAFDPLLQQLPVVGAIKVGPFASESKAAAPAAVRYTARQAAFSTPGNSLQSSGSDMYSLPDTSMHEQPLASNFVPVVVIGLHCICMAACPTAYPALFCFPINSLLVLTATCSLACR